METDNKRLLLELEKHIRQINREVIDPRISDLTVESIHPVMTMVANARADYLEALFAMTGEDGQTKPSVEQIKRLNMLRRTFEELLFGAKALETAIQRGYLSVHKD